MLLPGCACSFGHPGSSSYYPHKLTTRHLQCSSSHTVVEHVLLLGCAYVFGNRAIASSCPYKLISGHMQYSYIHKAVTWNLEILHFFQSATEASNWQLNVT